MTYYKFIASAQFDSFDIEELLEDETSTELNDGISLAKGWKPPVAEIIEGEYGPGDFAVLMCDPTIPVFSGRARAGALNFGV